MWLGLITTILGVIYDNFREVQNIIKPEYFGPILIFIGVVTQVFRFFTTLPLDDK
jgi:hypothetical protein